MYNLLILKHCKNTKLYHCNAYENFSFVKMKYIIASIINIKYSFRAVCTELSQIKPCGQEGVKW